MKHLKLGSHAIFFYDDQQELVQVFNSYLQGGLARDEAVHLIVPNRDVYANFLRTAGVADIDSLERDRRLQCVLILDACVDKGCLSSAKAIQSATKLAEEDRELGFKGTRTITQSTEQYYFAYCTPSSLLQYERELGQTFPVPLSGFCTYNARNLVDLGQQELLIPLFESHGQVIGKTIALPKD